MTIAVHSMDTNYSSDILKLESEAKLKGQEHAHLVARIEIQRIKKRIAELETTLISLDKEIEKSKNELQKLI